MSEMMMRPGVTLGSYPQRPEPSFGELEAMLRRWHKRLGHGLYHFGTSQKAIARRVRVHEDVLCNCTDAQFDKVIEEFRWQLHRQGLQSSMITRAFAVIREATARSLDKRHFDVQIYGGWLMINGMLAEMQTGEGKTLTTALPACTAALAGIPVHVITANDYLARRDCEILMPLYQRLGLSAAWVIDGMTPEECRQAYRADIVHTTNKKVAFDYLIDRIDMGEEKGDLSFQYQQLQARQEPVQGKNYLLRGLCFAIVDEADSVLIDEANTPLIITRTIPNEYPADTYGDALYLASSLTVYADYNVDMQHRNIELTVEGEDRLEELSRGLPKLWHSKRRREILARQALSAHQFYKRDRDYLILDDKVQIIDQATGRLMPERSWEQGLHQMIEAKEGCVISERREPQARISYQRFFSRYLRLAGTSGTLDEVKEELHRVYGLQVRKVAPRKPCIRRNLDTRVYRNLEDKRTALIQRIAEMQQSGRPVLVGTCSVEESEEASAWLHEAGIRHQVLNARQDEHEAEVVAVAGQRGAVTVATNMAGRGTDIALGDGIDQLGGLHVISTSLNDTRRLDRQLFGRGARQGDPGSAEVILSLQDEKLSECRGRTLMLWASRILGDGRTVPPWIARPVLRRAQSRFESRQNKIRKALTKQDKQYRRILAFSGKFQ